MRSVVFTNQKGGVGKSTLSVMFAQWLVEKQGQRVALIDLDSQGNSSKTLAHAAQGPLASALFMNTDFLPVTQTDLVVFAASKGLSDIELSRPEHILPAFRSQLHRLDSSFDWVVIDTPPTLGLRMSAALIAADEVVCPIELEDYSIDGLTDMLKTIFGVQRRYNEGLHLAGILANRFNPHSTRQKAALHDLVTRYSEFVIPAKISTRSAIPEALATGQSVWSLSKTSAREASAEVLKAFAILHSRMQAGAVATTAHELQA